MDLINSFLTRNNQFLQDSIAEGFQKLNLVDIGSLKETLSKALEDDDHDVLLDLLHETRQRNKVAASNLKKLKDNERRNQKAKANKPLKQDVSTEPVETKQPEERPRRKAFADATERVSSQVNQALNSKLRQEDVIVKREQVSTVAEEDNENEEQNRKIEDMPPPAALPKRAGRKKKTETLIKVEKIKQSLHTRSMRSKTNTILEEPTEAVQEETKGNHSDVMIVEQPAPLILLDANDDKEEQIEENPDEREAEQPIPVPPAPKNNIVAMTQAKNSKRFASSPANKKSASLPKRLKTKTSNPDRTSDSSQYEDAVNSPPEPSAEDFGSPLIKKMSHGDKEVVIQLPSVMLSQLPTEITANLTATKETLLNGTYVKPKANPNETVVVEKPLVVRPVEALLDENIDDIMTDDEDDFVESPPIVGTLNVAKELFNPFENSPLKKKVEAFEKLGSQAAAETVRVTRTKTRQKDAKAKATPPVKTSEKSPLPVMKYLTPTASNRVIPALAPTTKSNLSDSAKKALSAIKLTSQRFRNIEQAAKEKEAEALRKKEIILQKQTEDKRRKREEKEAKAKLQREEQEKERLRLQEAQKAKEELLNKRLQLQADRQQKQREEAEKRRQQARVKYELMKREEEERKRVEDERKREEARARQREQRQQEELGRQLQKPVYITQKAPLLPTPDCYDSDDENVPKVILPPWNTHEAMQLPLATMRFIHPSFRNTLFCPKPQTPDLQELFPNVDPSKLRRNSSAIWKEAPRFTMMPNIDEHF